MYKKKKDKNKYKNNNKAKTYYASGANYHQINNIAIKVFGSLCTNSFEESSTSSSVRV